MFPATPDFARRIFVPLLLGVAIAGLWIGFLSERKLAAQTEPREYSFNRDVRPILSNHCFACHGPDDKTRESGLRLDQPPEIDSQEILERILSDDDSEIMPPPDHKKPLDKKQIAILKAWLQQGAKYETHWAFQIPSKPNVPSSSHPVDFFVDRQLKARNLARSDPAAPAILIRRLYLDLVGLPPPIEVVDAFQKNPTRAAYEKIVDRLLESPDYGERWARRWLDLARYADTNGFEKDRDRSIWPYRDWVIQAINDDMPFDQFTIEQIAGDMLPNATDRQKIATGFHRNTMLNEEGGIDPQEYRYYAMVDRVATTGTTWLGMTIGCAQCHTHKYDPISHAEYFGLMAYLNNADEPDFFPDTASARQKRKADLARAEALMKKLDEQWPRQKDKGDGSDLESAFQAWLKKQIDHRANWNVLKPIQMTTNLPHLQLEQDGIIFASGDTTKHDTYTLKFPANDTSITAIRLEVLPDQRLHGGGPGMTFYEGRKGDFFLAELALIPKNENARPWAGASESYAKNQFGTNRVAAELALDGDFQSGWSVAGRQGFREVAVFNLKTPLEKGTPFTIKMEFGRHFASSLGKFRLSVANAPGKQLLASSLKDRELKLLDSDRREHRDELRRHFLMRAPQLEKQANQIRNLLRGNRGVSTLIMQERPENQKRKTYLYHRGEFTQPKQEISPALPESLKGPGRKAEPTNRLEFARWLVSRDNPLTARVIANRHWAAFFGTGLVSTLDDFGMQGAPPSHPRLLDFLAVELMDQKWSIKKLHRLIVTSETYQQSSSIQKNSTGSDKWLSRFPRRRLEAEVIRDTALSAAGLLHQKRFGPPVRPPQPKGAAVNFARSQWNASEGPDRFRRSIYTYQKRTAPFEMLLTFDGTSGEACIARRDVSNTPLQALTLLNDPMFVEIAQAFGNRMAGADGSTVDKIEFGFRLLLGRKPDRGEIEMLVAFQEKHQDWLALARVLICLDETITKN